MDNNFFSKMSQDILNEDKLDERSMRNFSGGVRRAARGAQRFVQSGIAAVKRWAKSVYTKTLRTLGIGVARTSSGFNLFNRNGEKLLSKDVKKITASKDDRSIVLSDSNIKMQVGQRFSFGAKWNKNAAVLKVLNFRPKPVNESVANKIDNVLNEYIQDTSDLDSTMNFGDEDDEGYSDSLEGLLDINTAHVDYKGLEDAMDELIDGLHASTDDNVTISLVGDSGIGKTEIIKSLAAQKHMNFFYVELGKIDPALIKGIPAITDSFKVNDQGEKESHQEISLLMAENIFPRIREEISKGSMSVNANGGDKWLIFLDEFNRADTRVTSVIMNLFLDGMITAAIKSEYDESTGKLVNKSGGGAISLPKNSVYVVGMNESSEKGGGNDIGDLFQEVNELDVATTSRITHSFILNANLEAWSDNLASLPKTVEYKKDGKKTDVIVYPQIPNILQKFMRKLDSDNEGGVFSMPFASSADNKAKMDPRRWSAISKEYYRLAWLEWNKLSEARQYSEFNKKIAWQHYKIMQRNRSAMDNSTAKTSRSSKAKYDEILKKLKGMTNDEIKKELAFTAWAANSLPLAQKLLNDVKITSMFGVGVSNDEGSREENIKEFLRGMHNWLVKEANASIPSEQFVFGYDAMKRGRNNKDMSKLSTKIKKVYDVDVKTGKRDSTLLETTEIASKINNFFDAIQLGTTKQVETTREFQVNGSPVDKLVPGNYIFAKKILGAGSPGREPITLDIIHADEKEFKKYTKENTYGYSKAVSGKLEQVKEAKTLYAKLEKVIEAALKMVSENILHIVKDFSDNSEDIVQAIVNYLEKVDNSQFDNLDSAEMDEKSKKSFESRVVFNTPFSELLIMSLNNNEDFQAIGATSGAKEARAMKKTASAAQYKDIPESSVLSKLFDELLD